MNYKIRVTSVVGGETVSPTDMKLIPAGRNTGIQPSHKGYRLWIKTNNKAQNFSGLYLQKKVENEKTPGPKVTGVRSTMIINNYIIP